MATSNTRNRYDSTKAEYKSAKKAYNKALNKASSYSSNHYIGQFTNKKKKAESDARWNDAADKAKALNKAESAYKQAKAQRKEKIRKTYTDIQKNASVKERLIYNDATRKRAAKYVVDNKMTVEQAKKRASKDATRNTAVLLGVYGTVAVASLYATKR